MELKKTLIFLLYLLFFSCSEDESQHPSDGNTEMEFISAVDISSFPEIELTSPVFKDSSGNIISFLNHLESKGINTIRLRLWVNPIDQHSGFNEVKSFSEILKSMGFKIYLSLHYSDTWADPGKQITPAAWESFSFSELKNAVYEYTRMVVQEISPDIIQIGNEINNGFLHPLGNIHNEPSNFKELINECIRAVRDHSLNQVHVMLHYAGHEGSEIFFDSVKDVDYDIIGLSYYPIWHGKSIDNLEQGIIQLRSLYNKDIMIAETAYPFTLGWNDWTNNIVGLEEHLILPNYPASPYGQKEFIQRLKTLISNTDGGIGLSYWGAELIAWNGEESNEGSVWENQALFDFNNQALPVLDVF